MQNGYFEGVRDPLAYIAAHTDLPTVKTLTDRMNLLSAELEDWKSASTQYVTDFFSHLNELYKAGLVPSPYHPNDRENFEKEFLAYMQDGKFDSFRRVLKDVEESANTGTPAVTALRDRLEKLSDRWDATLVCKIEPFYDFDTSIDRSIVHTYKNQDGQLIPGAVVFSGTLAQCQSIVAGLGQGTLTLRQVRQPDFEPPAALEPKYIYKMDANPHMVGADDQHFIQAYERTERDTLIPGVVLFVGRADVCSGLLEQLNNGALRQEDFFTVKAARISCYTTKDGAELDAFVAPDEKVYLGRRDHYDNRGHYLNNDNTLIHIADNDRVFNVISGSDIPYTHEELWGTGYFTQEEFERFTALQLNEPQKETEALFLVDDAVYLHIQATDDGWDYSLYEKDSRLQREGGQLDICSGSHLLCTANQNTHLTGTHFCEQFFLLHIGLGLMDKRHLIGAHPSGNEFLPDVLIDGERLFRFQGNSIFQHMQLWIVQLIPGSLHCPLGRGCFWRGNIAENKLGELLIVTLPPAFQDILYTAVDLRSRLIGEGSVNNTLIEAQFASIAGYFQHVIQLWVYLPGVDFTGSLRQFFHHCLLNHGRLGSNGVILHFRGGKVQLVSGLDVRDLFEHIH
ncbi:MAG: hypothetical protein K2N78_09360 [Oscillospiraceae bacterium]|nr:hypothetical protein [Oscillospiraceae bacterium]